MSEVSKNQVCRKCGSSELQVLYFTHELDHVNHKTTLTFNPKFSEGWAKTFRCSKCKNIPIKFNILT